MSNIKVIPARKALFASAGQAALSLEKRRTAGYARVSTEKEEQETSFEAQVKYYTEYIQSRSDWEFVDVYTDDGISATSTKKRDGFNQMVADAMAGKIDLIVTKSVSRFARNTVDSLTTVRMLKEKGIEIFFEKEQIWTFDSKGELLITIMSSLAQEESRSISENTTWGQRRRMQEGRVSMAYGQFLGYDRGEDGKPVINESEAQIVRLIYRLFIEGKTPSAIGRYLMSHGIPSPAGKKTWQTSVVKSILTNEKYAGNALLQKGFTVDFLTKARKKNEGEVPQFWVDGSHPAIIALDEWEAVQAEMARRTALGRPMGCNSPFSTRIVCGECGGYFGSKVWGSNTKYRRTIWRCNDKYKGDSRCQTPHITEDDIKARFLAVWNSMTERREELVSDCCIARGVLCDCSAIEAEITALDREIEVTTELTRKAIHENARTAQKQSDFNKQSNAYLKRLQAARERIEELTEEMRKRKHQGRILETYIRNLENSRQALTEFDDKLWVTTIERVTVGGDGELVFRFMDGTERPG